MNEMKHVLLDVNHAALLRQQSDPGHLFASWDAISTWDAASWDRGAAAAWCHTIKYEDDAPLRSADAR